MPDLMEIKLSDSDTAPLFVVRVEHLGSLEGVALAEVLADFKAIYSKAFVRALATKEHGSADNITSATMEECEEVLQLHLYELALRFPGGAAGAMDNPTEFEFRARLETSRVQIPKPQGPMRSENFLAAYIAVMGYSQNDQGAWVPPFAGSEWVAARKELAGAAALLTSVFNASALNLVWCATWGCVPTSPQNPNPSGFGDMGFVHVTYDDRASCDKNSAQCMRGVCMGSDTDSRGTVSKDVNGDVEYCYRSGSADPYTVTDCSVGYSCSLPGPRHGHRAVTLTVHGKVLTYAVFGGESTHLVPSSGSTSKLSNDVHVLRFAGALATWLKLRTSCDYVSGGEPMCPAQRRDAAIAVMGNSGGETGRLLVFGGFGGPEYRHGMFGYLEQASSASSVEVFHDLWYLDMAELEEDCVLEGLCGKTLYWHLVDVTGARPGTGFGAGTLLDGSANLYITGGADSSFRELDELFIFQLRDPLYKHCSASGATLTKAMAGVKSIFYLQCMDAFMEPADGATFKVDISGPVGMVPGIVALGAGKYSCTFSPVTVGTYTLSIYVGRGGDKYQDLITGIDSEPSNKQLDGEFEKLCSYTDEGSLSCKAAQNPYTLTVVPGGTSPSVTTALGAFLTLSTAGTASEFVITAKDAFGNRRPGGDSITALMMLWNCKGMTIGDRADADECVRIGTLQDTLKAPETGTVTDNADGSYATSYLITRAGQYVLSIGFAGSVGADSPFVLTVLTDVADKALSYVYGNLQGIAAGVASELYVQTRDQFGNAIRTDDQFFPLAEVNGGTEDIQFQVCKSVGADTRLPCSGGEQYTAVGITIRYSVGPDGKQKDPGTGDPYFGLYQITFFPFTPEPVLPRVLHASKEEEEEAALVVQCYFDTTGIPPVRQLMDPGAELANACVEQVKRSQATARRTGRPHQPPPFPPHPTHPRLPTIIINPRTTASETQGPDKRRLSPTSVSSGDLLVTIEATFMPPNTGSKDSCKDSSKATCS